MLSEMVSTAYEGVGYHLLRSSRRPGQHVCFGSILLQKSAVSDGAGEPVVYEPRLWRAGPGARYSTL